MKLDIVFKEMDSTDGIKARIHSNAKKLERFVAADEYIRVVVEANFKGQQHKAEIYWHDNHLAKDIHASAEGHDLYAQIDEVFDKAYRQVKTEHERNTDAKRKRESVKKSI